MTNITNEKEKIKEKGVEKIYGPLPENQSFMIDNYNEIFKKDGLVYQFMSGSVHYFRVPSIYWNDRLHKMKSAGVDAIQTDIPWNFHEKEENHFDFSGEHDLEQFIYTAHQNKLLVIVRIGPYIGGDWSFGGLPPWLLRKHPNIRMRSSDKNFIDATTNWFKILLQKLKPHLYENGGPIIMIQIENDYGILKVCDRRYIAVLNDVVRQHLGNNVILSTSDLGNKQTLKCGSPFANNLATVRFGTYDGDPDDMFTDLFYFQPDSPWVNSEYYTGLLDHWGFRHHHVSPHAFVDGLVRMIRYSPRISVNIYMFHGGTNFGLWNGAVRQPYSAHVTSYDFNAPIAESGDTTYLYHLLRESIAQLKNVTLPEVPENTTRTAYEAIDMTLVSHILPHAVAGKTTRLPLSMEAMGQYGGFMVYRTEFYRKEGETVELKLRKLADYAYVYTGSNNFHKLVYHGSVSRNDRSLTLKLKIKLKTTDLLIMVENAGYVSYSTNGFRDHKGILGPVSVDGKELVGWTMMHVCLTPDKLNKCKDSVSETISKNWRNLLTEEGYDDRSYAPHWPVQGSIYAGSLEISKNELVTDTFVHAVNFTRGVIIVNDRVLGRYNQALGPQLRIFLPKSFLHTGTNTIIVFELDGLWLNETIYMGFLPTGNVYPLGFSTDMVWTEKVQKGTNRSVTILSTEKP